MNDFEFIDDASVPEPPTHQVIFDELMDRYNDGIEPLECWTTGDIVSLIQAADIELQSRVTEHVSYDESSNDDEFFQEDESDDVA